MLLDQEKNTESELAQVWKKLETKKAIAERLVAVVQIPWSFAELNCKGISSRRKAFELFDEVICELLLKEEGLEGLRIRQLLGLNDDLGQKAFEAMIAPLLGLMIDGDESYYFLTEKGKKFAALGAKYEERKEAFALKIDLRDKSNVEAHQTFKTIQSARLRQPNASLEIENETDQIDEYFALHETLLPYVEAQEPRLHFPTKSFFLEESTILNIQIISCNIWVGVFEELETNELAYTALSIDGLSTLTQISNIISQPEQTEIHQQISEAIRIQYENELTTQEKSPIQIEDDEWLVAQAKSIANAVPAQEKLIREKAFESRKTFSTHEFEDEIKQLERNCKGEIWMISPWVRPRAFSIRRKQIEAMLKNGTKVMLGYSAPHERGQEMIPIEQLREFEEIQKKHLNFYYAELPQFHEKIMFADYGSGKRYEYTGSFNVLSFAIGKQAKIGRENMRRLAWGEDSQKNFEYQKAQFVLNYEKRFQAAQQQILRTAPESKSEIKKLDTTLAAIEGQFHPFFAYINGETLKTYDKQVAAVRKHIHSLKLKWMAELIQSEIDKIQGNESIVPNVAKEAEVDLSNHLKDLSLNESELIVPLQQLQQLWSKQSLRYELDMFQKKLSSLRGNRSRSELEHLRKSYAQIGTTYPKTNTEDFNTVRRAIEKQLQVIEQEIEKAEAERLAKEKAAEEKRALEKSEKEKNRANTTSHHKKGKKKRNNK